LEKKKTYKSYMGFRLDIISDLICETEEKDSHISFELKNMAMKHNVKNFRLSNDNLGGLEKKLEHNEQILLREYRKNRDRIDKLNGLLKTLEKNYENFNLETSFQIPFTLSSKGYGILQGVQFPDTNPELIKELIDLNPLEERLEDLEFNRNKDNIDIVLTCHSTKGTGRERIESTIEKLQSYGEIFLYVGDKLYILRENATKSKEPYDINAVGRKRELAIIKYMYERIEELTKELDLIFRYVY